MLPLFNKIKPLSKLFSRGMSSLNKVKYQIRNMQLNAKINPIGPVIFTKLTNEHIDLIIDIYF